MKDTRSDKEKFSEIEKKTIDMKLNPNYKNKYKHLTISEDDVVFLVEYIRKLS